jgi:hypothetical protein
MYRFGDARRRQSKSGSDVHGPRMAKLVGPRGRSQSGRKPAAPRTDPFPDGPAQCVDIMIRKDLNSPNCISVLSLSQMSRGLAGSK